MDMHTLHIEHATLLGLYTVLTVVNSRLHRGTRGVNWFPVYNLYAFLGATLIVFRGIIPQHLSVIGGSFCFSLAYVFLHRSLTEFFGRRAFQWKLQAALAAASFLFLTQYGLLSPNTRLRIVWFSIVMSIQVGLSALFVLRNARRHLFESAVLMGWILIGLSAIVMARAVGTLLFGSPQTYTEGRSLLNSTLLGISVLQGGATMAFVWMTAAELRHELHIQANTDPLTRLKNRRSIELAAEREILRSHQTGLPLAAILIDLDNFKAINDSFGHARGDAILRAVAHCLQQGMRENDHLARLGGDEFAILLPTTNQSTATGIAERLRSCLEAIPLESDHGASRIHASFGVAVCQTAQDWSQLIASCDRALYQAKRSGGNNVLVSTSAWEGTAIAG
jgi:diguanylate cyclase (GGDEF)-like protein